jgi:threonyl-tRNA synthetase
MFSFDDAEAIPALCLKPMSCPCHVQVFNQRVRSYRELPVRYSEFGACHRDEPSGSREGLKRARVRAGRRACVLRTCAYRRRVVRFCSLLRDVYADLGFPSFEVVGDAACAAIRSRWNVGSCGGCIGECGACGRS